MFHHATTEWENLGKSAKIRIRDFKKSACFCLWEPKYCKIKGICMSVRIDLRVISYTWNTNRVLYTSSPNNSCTA